MGALAGAHLKPLLPQHRQHRLDGAPRFCQQLWRLGNNLCDEASQNMLKTTREGWQASIDGCHGNAHAKGLHAAAGYQPELHRWP